MVKNAKSLPFLKGHMVARAKANNR